MDKVIELNTISMMHYLLHLKKPENPLISFIDFDEIQNKADYVNMRFYSGFYSIMYTEQRNYSTFKYGRNSFDLEGGSLIFVGHGQTVMIEKTQLDLKGWMLNIHPDYMKETWLKNKINTYSYFSYSRCKSLSLTDGKYEKVLSMLTLIKNDISKVQSVHTKQVILSNLEMLLNYSKRLYNMETLQNRKNHKDAVYYFNLLLEDALSVEKLNEKGIPTTESLAKSMAYSTNYLGNMLKKETGLSTQEHIRKKLLEKAEELLLGSNASITEISRRLGFVYQTHFSRFFKKMTGLSPREYRK